VRWLRMAGVAGFSLFDDEPVLRFVVSSEAHLVRGVEVAGSSMSGSGMVGPRPLAEPP
jgi:hypothetical protein